MLSNIARDYSDESRELRALFEKQLKELFWAEQAMVERLPEIAQLCTSKDLVAALENHLAETDIHASRLNKIFAISGLEPEIKTYEALNCFFKETEELTVTTRKGVVRDAGIIAVLQKVKHYEIACYGTMRAHAIALREEEAITLFERTLQEEKDFDLVLSSIAESHINTEAADKEV